MTTASITLLLTVCGQVPTGHEVRVLGGEPIIGRLLGVAADGSVVVGEQTIAAGEWYSIRKTNTVLPPWPRDPHVELTNGDRLVGGVIDADGDALRWRVHFPGEPRKGDQELRLPLSSVRAIWFTHRPGDAPEPNWLTSPRKRDLFQSRNGDSTAGALTAIDPGRNAVRFQVDGRDQNLEFAKLAAIALNTDLARVRRPKGPYYRMTLADGSRLSVLSASFDGRIWDVNTQLKGPTMHVPADQVVSVDVEQGKAAWLSNLKPAKYQYFPSDGEQFPLMLDRCASGRPMVLKTDAGESTFDRGIGLHGECTLNYSLGGKYRRFETLAGLDAKSGLQGDAQVVISVDGKEQPLPNDGRITVRGGPTPLRIDLTGARELAISIRRGSGGNVQDYVDLTGARLIP